MSYRDEATGEFIEGEPHPSQRLLQSQLTWLEDQLKASTADYLWVSAHLWQSTRIPPPSSHSHPSPSPPAALHSSRSTQHPTPHTRFHLIRIRNCTRTRVRIPSIPIPLYLSGERPLPGLLSLPARPHSQAHPAGPPSAEKVQRCGIRGLTPPPWPTVTMCFHPGMPVGHAYRSMSRAARVVPYGITHPIMTITHPITIIVHPTTIAHPITIIAHPITLIAHPVTSIAHPITAASGYIAGHDHCSSHYEKDDLSFVVAGEARHGMGGCGACGYWFECNSPLRIIPTHGYSGPAHGCSSITPRPHLDTTPPWQAPARNVATVQRT